MLKGHAQKDRSTKDQSTTPQKDLFPAASRRLPPASSELQSHRGGGRQHPRRPNHEDAEEAVHLQPPQAVRGEGALLLPGRDHPRSPEGIGVPEQAELVGESLWNS